MKIAFFGYAWGPAARVDAYMQEVIEGYRSLGFEVDVFLGNYFSADGAVSGIKNTVSRENLAAFIRGEGYAAGISINNSMLTPEIIEALDGHVVSVIVDGFNHLFRYDAQDPYAAFRSKARFAVIGSQFERDLLAAVPGIAPRLRLLSPATNGMFYPRDATPSLYPISWVASLPTGPAAESWMAGLIDEPDAHAVAADCLQAIEEAGDLSAFRARNAEAMDAAIARLNTDFRAFEMMLQDIVTARQRVEIVNRLAPHGLALFGNKTWSKAMVLSREAFAAFQPGAPVSTHDDLLRVYNSSKISVNLPQSFIAESFQYRLLDVMSSNALLVTRRTPEPDLHRVFGADCPVPMYDTAAELEAICAHYLAHEDERRARVEACNRLVTQEFSFASRCRDYLAFAGVTYQPPFAAPAARKDVRVLTDQGFA